MLPLSGLWRRLRSRTPWKHTDSGPGVEHWDSLWQTELLRPEQELATTVPQDLKDAVSSGWIRPGSTILDIGAGGGQISAWLATQGFRVVGIDLAPAATALARRRWSQVQGHLEFRTLDVCAPDADAGFFDAFVDRGCYHTSLDHAAYVRNVSRWARPGARVLLFHRFLNKWSTSSAPEAQVERRVREAFAPHFAVESVARTKEPIVRATGPVPRVSRPGAVCRLVAP